MASPRLLLLKAIAPAIGGMTLPAALVLSIKSYLPADSSSSSFAGVGGIFLIGAGSLLAGVVLLLVARWKLPAFFAGGALPPLRQQAAAGGPAGQPAAGVAAAGGGAANRPAARPAPVPRLALGLRAKGGT